MLSIIISSSPPKMYMYVHACTYEILKLKAENVFDQGYNNVSLHDCILQHINFTCVDTHGLKRVLAKRKTTHILTVLPLLIFIYPKFNYQKSVVCNHKISREIRAQNLLTFLLIPRLQCIQYGPDRPTALH